MKKISKIVLIIVFVLCFLGLFSRPAPALAFDDINAFTAIQQYQELMQAEHESLLNQFYTYSYLGLELHDSDGSVTSYRVNIVIDSIFPYTSNGDKYIRYYVGTGSYYYDSTDVYNIPHSFSGTVTVRYYNDVAYSVGFLSHTYWFEMPSGGYSRYGLVTYCDLSDSAYTNHSDGSSLRSHNLYTLPPSFVNGTISTPASGSTLGDNIISARDTSYTPPVTTSPPYNPPATIPPSTFPPVIVTALPPETDLDGSYIVDYSPYIDGNFYSPPVTEDISLSPYIGGTANIITMSYDFLSGFDFYGLLLAFMLGSFAIYLII